ncbi:MAG TPA: NAD-dependent epimerase/dehydratase family protein [Roseivirga sp.]
MKVFITGATGLLGSFICQELLKKGHQIKAIKRPSSKMILLEDIADEIQWVTGELSDTVFLEEILTGVEAVIHGAAVISFDKRYEEKMYQTNVLGTADLINICLKLDIKNFLHISSVAALGRKGTKTEIDEKDRWEGTKYDSIYARSKNLQELEVWRGAQEGLNVKIINPSVILGPGLWDQNGSSSVFYYAHKGRKFHPSGNVNYVDVRDVAEIAVLLMESNIQGERYVVSAGSLPYKEFLTVLSNAFGRKGPTIQVKRWMLRFAVGFEYIRSRITGNEALVNRDTAILSKSKFHFKNDKIRKELNFEFRPLEETVAWTAQELKKRYKL